MVFHENMKCEVSYLELNEIYMVELYINKHNKNILKFIAKYFPHFINAKSYSIDYAAEV